MTEAEYEALDEPEKQLVEKVWSYFCGYGLVSLASPNEFGAGPCMRYKLWNTREAKAADINKFDKMTGSGRNLERYNPAYAVTVAVDLDCLEDEGQDLSMTPVDAVPLSYMPETFAEETRSSRPLAILVDGHHRHVLICKLHEEKIKTYAALKQALDDRSAKGKGRQQDVEELERQLAMTREDLEQQGQWLARIYDLCGFLGGVIILMSC